jgi:hypothetical protein
MRDKTYHHHCEILQNYRQILTKNIGHTCIVAVSPEGLSYKQDTSTDFLRIQCTCHGRFLPKFINKLWETSTQMYLIGQDNTPF